MLNVNLSENILSDRINYTNGHSIEYNSVNAALIEKKLIKDYNIQINPTYDSLLTPFAKAILKDRYLLKGEDYQQMFARVSKAFADDNEHSQRLYDYMGNHWFMPATPILSNGGANRGLPVSCYLNSVSDSMEGIVEIWNENVWLASKGGGIGTSWSNVRSLNEVVKGGKTSGIVPFIKVQDAQTLAVSQGGLRRGSAAVYLHISHPEIEEFIDIRKPTGGDPNRKSLNINNAVCVDDKFMIAVRDNTDYELLSPKTKEVIRTVNARNLWIKILTTRIETGEPYLLFIDTVNKAIPIHHKALGLAVNSSNLCVEITLPTGIDHLGKDRTAVCCLSSLNLEYWDEWKDNSIFIEDIMRFLDNVLQNFIDNAPNSMEKAKYSAMRERSVGLGVMGFVGYLQKKLIPLDSALAKSFNFKAFSYIKEKVDTASKILAIEKGVCPDALECGILERFSNKTAIAPTASISIIANSSPCIEPWNANSFTQKTLSGNFTVKNPYLVKLLEEKGQNTESTWSKILRNEGSVKELDCLSDLEKDVFKTSWEINPYLLIELAADRTKFIDQSQSVNLFLPSNIDKADLHRLHYMAWEKGLKSLYYCRSLSSKRAEKISSVVRYEECHACQ